MQDGPLKWATGSNLAIGLIFRDPAAALSWSIASRHTGQDAANMASMAACLGGNDYEQAESIIAASDLSDPEKHKLLNAAKLDWNRTRAYHGEWDRILPVETSKP